MFYEINLVKDRVAPRDLPIKRALIVGSFVAVMIIGALLITFFGLRQQTDIQVTEDQVEMAEEQLASYQSDRRRTDVERQATDAAVTEKARLFALNQGIVYPAALYALAYQFRNDPNKGFENEKIGVVYFGFNDSANQQDNLIRMILVLSDFNVYGGARADTPDGPLAAYLDSNFRRQNGQPTEMMERYGLELLAHEDTPTITIPRSRISRRGRTTDAGNGAFTESAPAGGVFVELTFKPLYTTLFTPDPERVAELTSSTRGS